ncbi:MAG TPA: hypothetical protein VJS47_00400 [Rhizomicrobium sp.]|nr:hypothetical protein [Rhizomicrobium sp.]
MGGSSHTETSTKVDPAQMALYRQNYNRANEVADLPFQPYTGERVAGFNALLAAAGDPTAGHAISRAQDAVGSLLNYRVPTIAAPSAVTPVNVSAGQLSGTDLSPYLNPYTNDVVHAALGDLAHAREVQGLADNAAAAAAHAFGGTRQAVLNANTTNDYLRNVASTTAGLRQAGYQNAQQAALSDIANRLAADQYNAGNRLTADQFNATGAYNANVANAANDLAGAGLRSNAANQYASLGQDYFNQLGRQASLYSLVGSQQQALQQAQNDAAYAEFMRQLNYPYQQQQLRNQALGMMPLQQTQSTTSSSSPGVLDVLNTASHFISPFNPW